MNGVYKFYQNGKQVGEQKNLITTFGRNAILQYLAGIGDNFAANLHFGINPVAPTVDDTSLGFETVSAPIYVATPDYLNTTIVYKARINDAGPLAIYEAGMSSGSTDRGSASSALLLNFDQAIEYWDSGTWNTTNVRLGDDNLRLSPAASATVTSTLADVYLDLSSYSNLDEFKLAYAVSNANCSNITLRLYTDQTSFFTYSINSPASGYRFSSFNKSQVTTTGSPDWSTITQVVVSATATGGGSADIDLEGFRVDNKDIGDEGGVLVSRTALSTPVVKAAGLPLDIEYTLDIT